MKRKQAAAAKAAEKAAEKEAAEAPPPPPEPAGVAIPEAEPEAPAAPQAFHPPEDMPAPPPVEESPEAPESRAAARSVGALSAKVAMLSERLKAQESAAAKIASTLERIDATLGELTKRTQPMLETLSAELARQSAMVESLKTDSESNLEVQSQRSNEFEQRLGSVLREMRELVAGKVESWEIQLKDRLEEARSAFAEQLATFEDRVEDLVRRFAAEAIPAHMKEKVEDLSGRFVHAETALAATRSSVEFLRAEVGSLTMTVRKLTPAE